MSNERGNSEQAVVLGLPPGATPRCSLEVQSTVDGHGSACVMVDRARAVGPARNAGKPERMPIQCGIRAIRDFVLARWLAGLTAGRARLGARLCTIGRGCAPALGGRGAGDGAAARRSFSDNSTRFPDRNLRTAPAHMRYLLPSPSACNSVGRPLVWCEAHTRDRAGRRGMRATARPTTTSEVPMPSLTLTARAQRGAALID